MNEEERRIHKERRKRQKRRRKERQKKKAKEDRANDRRRRIQNEIKRAIEDRIKSGELARGTGTVAEGGPGNESKLKLTGPKEKRAKRKDQAKRGAFLFQENVDMLRMKVARHIRRLNPQACRLTRLHKAI